MRANVLVPEYGHRITRTHVCSTVGLSTHLYKRDKNNSTARADAGDPQQDIPLLILVLRTHAHATAVRALARSPFFAGVDGAQKRPF